MLEAGERCADTNRHRTGEGRANHNGTFCRATTDWDRGDLRCRDTSRIVASPVSHGALAVGAVIRR